MTTVYDQCACCGSHDVRDTSADERYPERVRIYCHDCYDGAPDGSNRLASTAEEWSEMQRDDAAELGRRSPVSVAAALERGCVRAMIELHLDPERLPACSIRSYADWAVAQVWGSIRMARAGRDIDRRLRWVLRDDRDKVIAGSVERDERAAYEDMLAQVAADCGLVEIGIEVVP